jgi:hypothetical protein
MQRLKPKQNHISKIRYNNEDAINAGEFKKHELYVTNSKMPTLSRNDLA